MNLKCCWTDAIAIVYLIMYNIYITITIIYVIFWMYRHNPLSLYLQLQLINYISTRPKAVGLQFAT